MTAQHGRVKTSQVCAWFMWARFRPVDGVISVAGSGRPKKDASGFIWSDLIRPPSETRWIWGGEVCPGLGSSIHLFLKAWLLSFTRNRNQAHVSASRFKRIGNAALRYETCRDMFCGKTNSWGFTDDQNEFIPINTSGRRMSDGQGQDISSCFIKENQKGALKGQST